jgi:hypothetical protein
MLQDLLLLYYHHINIFNIRKIKRRPSEHQRHQGRHIQKVTFTKNLQKFWQVFFRFIAYLLSVFCATYFILFYLCFHAY